MRILLPEEVALADRLTCQGQGISSAELMERAASALSEAMRRRFPLGMKRVLVVCGPGNNGGDGLALARLLSDAAELTVFLPAGMHKTSEDHRFMQSCLNPSITVAEGNIPELAALAKESELLVDALFGAGLNRPLEGHYAELVRQMNAAACFKVAVDIPSGLLPEMPENAVAFRADHVFTFHSPKPAFLIPSSADYVKEFSVLDIGLTLPPETGKDLYFQQAEDIRLLLKARSRFSHKGTYGHALLLAGSEGKMGAALLAARALLRSGAGLLTVQVPACGRDVIQLGAPEAMVLPDSAEKHLSQFPDPESISAIGMGPGIGRHPETAALLGKLMQSGKPMVLDADALNILSGNPELLRMLPENSILTPHPKEFARLSGFRGSDYTRIQAARDFASEHKVILILKGAYTLICSPDGRAWFNSTGNPGMAKGGSGDVLTGLLTGLLARGYAPESAARLGVFLHGLAGDKAAARLGMEAMLPGDLIDSLSEAWRELSFD
jgi:NAD(P)H-hydrate epimerase